MQSLMPFPCLVQSFWRELHVLLKQPGMGEKNSPVSRESERSLFSHACKAERAVCRSLFCSPKCLPVLKKMMCVLLCSLAKHLKAQQRVFLKCNCNRNAWKTQEAETASTHSVKSLGHVVQAWGDGGSEEPAGVNKAPFLACANCKLLISVLEVWCTVCSFLTYGFFETC